MGIWLWIIIAWGISILLLYRQRVSFEHYIWILLPVDMYGISVAGAIIKPYMFFCAILLLRMFLNKDTKIRLYGRWALVSGVLTVLLFCMNLLNNQSTSSPKAALMMVVVWVCAMTYLSSCKESIWIDIPKAIIAAGIGYGIVFVLGYCLMNVGIEVPGIVAGERSQSGMFLKFSNMFQGSLIHASRLRGFTVDPNTLIGPFAFCSGICILRIYLRKGRILEWLGLVLSGICVLLSNSRMGLICFVMLIFGTIVAGYRVANTRIRKHLKVGTLIIVFGGAIIIATTDIVSNIIKIIFAAYANRSGLTDEYGRLTIWEDAISVLFEHNLIFGIGMGQMQYYTTAQRACHNTWLEMVCGSGIILGGALVLCFIFLVNAGLLKAFQNRNLVKAEVLWGITIGLLAVMISLISVDNITYSYLWFGAAMLSAVMNGYLTNTSWKKRS